MRSRLVAVLAVAMVGCGSSKPAGKAPEATSPEESTRGGKEHLEHGELVPPLRAEGEGTLESDDTGALADALFEAANASRAENGLGALVRARDLDAVAAAYSRELATRPGELSHDSPISGGPGDRVRAAGITFVRLKENLAKAPSAAVAHDGLMRSPGHRANILDRDVREMGVGVVIVEEDGARGLIATELFASRPVAVNAKKAAAGLIERLNQRRKAAKLRSLARNAWLDARAKEALEGCFEDKPPRAIGLGAGAPVSKARTMGFLIGEIAQLEAIIDAGKAELMEADQSLVGIAVAQGEHVTLGEGVICVRIVVGSGK